MIDIKELSKSDGKINLLDSLSYRASRCGVHGIVGASDRSVRALLDIMCALSPYSSGYVKTADVDVKRHPKKAKQKIGYMQSPCVFYEDMTVYEHLNFIGEAKAVSYDKLFKNIKSALELTGIEGLSERLISKLSAAEKQKLAFASAMLGNPELIVLASPTSFLSERDFEDMAELIKKLGKVKTVVVASADMKLIERVCDDLLIISNGKPLMHGTIAEISERLSKNKALSITVKGKEEAVVNKLSEISEISGCTVLGSVSGALSLKLEYKSCEDIREKVFSLFAAASMPVLSMEEVSVGLSDLYARLCESEKTIEGGKAE